MVEFAHSNVYNASIFIGYRRNSYLLFNISVSCFGICNQHHRRPVFFTYMLTHIIEMGNAIPFPSGRRYWRSYIKRQDVTCMLSKTRFNFDIRIMLTVFDTTKLSDVWWNLPSTHLACRVCRWRIYYRRCCLIRWRICSRSLQSYRSRH